LSKFAKMTTKRLQEVRAIDPGRLKGSRKATINQEDVAAMLRARKSPVEAFYREILEVLPEDALAASVSEGLFKTGALSLRDASSLLSYEINTMYNSVKLIDKPIPVPVYREQRADTEQINYTVKTVNRFVNILGNIRDLTSRCAKQSRLYTYPAKARSAVELLESFKSIVKVELKKLREEDVQIGIDYGYLPIYGTSLLETQKRDAIRMFSELKERFLEISELLKSQSDTQKVSANFETILKSYLVAEKSLDEL
jgi:hypothetical protein